MFFSLKGKTAFITSGGQGIGFFVAKRFIEAGAKVVIADIKEENEKAAEEIGARFVRVNVADEESHKNALKKAVELLGSKLDIVVNNAGLTDVGFTIEETDQEMLKKMTEVNNYGVFYSLKHAPSNMNDEGSIINVSSAAAIKGIYSFSLYSATKATVISYTKHGAMELAPRGIRVNAILPGRLGCGAGYEEGIEIFCGGFAPFGRLGRASEIMGAFHF